MKRGIVFLSVVAVLIGAFALGRARAQEDAGGDKAAAEQAMYEKFATPGPEHQGLMKAVGAWTVDCKFWMQPGAAPVETKATAVFTSLLGGRYLRQEYKGMFMGRPFEGIGCTGFNNATRKYEDVWIDSMSTAMMVMRGTETTPGKVWEFSGTSTGPDGKETKMRSVMTKVSDDEQVVEMFGNDGGVEMKWMELRYTREKK